MPTVIGIGENMKTTLNTKVGKILSSLVLIALLLGSTGSSSSVARAEEAGKLQLGEYGTLSTLSLSNGTLIQRHGINGPSTPPPGFEDERTTVALSDGVSINGMADLPGSIWFFGCSATAAADIAAYYDNYGYTNIYAGPENSGNMPMGYYAWPVITDVCPTAAYSSSPSTTVSATGGGDVNGVYYANPLIASMKGVNGRTNFGSIDDYWIEYNSSEPDPYTGSSTGCATPLAQPTDGDISSQAGWTQHTWGDAIGDYMFTSQSAYGNWDGETAFYRYASSAILTCDVMESQHLPDGTLGRKNFYEARGYSVAECYNQRTDNAVTGGFSLAQFRAEIDAGRPVMLGLAGHSVVGVDYDPLSNMIYIHDGWDNDTHTMEWGGSYSGMALQDVSIVNLAATISGNTEVPGVVLSYVDGTPKSVTSDSSGNYSFNVMTGWSGTVTPSKPGYTFDPPSTTYSNIEGNQTDQDYDAIQNAVTTVPFTSTAANDGWTLESSEYSSRANARNAIGNLFVGDNAKNRQYRSLLYFDTSSLPEDKLILSVTLKIMRAGITGTDPFTTHGPLFAEMKNSFFGKSPLENTDFQAVAYPKRSVGNFTPVDGEPGWYKLVLQPANFKYVNLNSVTQFRIRFTRDDDNDKIADFVSFYSGDDATNPPELIIEYTTP
jgi:hypothetical protein